MAKALTVAGYIRLGCDENLTGPHPSSYFVTLALHSGSSASASPALASSAFFIKVICIAAQSRVFIYMRNSNN